MIRPKARLSFIAKVNLVMIAVLAALSFLFAVNFVRAGLFEHPSPGSLGAFACFLIVGVISLVYLIRRRFAVGAQAEFEPNKIVRVETLPKHVRLHFLDQKARYFCVERYDLEDLRSQLEASVLPRLVQEAEARLAQGEATEVTTSYSFAVLVATLVSVGMAQDSAVLGIVHFLVFFTILGVLTNRTTVARIHQTGLELSNGEYLSWESVVGLRVTHVLTLVCRDREISLGSAIHEQAWLYSRLVQRMSRCGVVYPPSLLGRIERARRHSHFVGSV